MSRMRTVNCSSMYKTPVHYAAARCLAMFTCAALVLAILPITPSIRQATAAVGLDAPTGITVVNDDRNAILAWGPRLAPDQHDAPGVAGYRILWGPQGGTQVSVLSSYRTIQLQPLTPGIVYVATVQAVDTYGHLGIASAPVTLQSDSTRVDGLRTSMTGFFDDFNTPSGALDSLKWASAASICAKGPESVSFINAQFHAHTMASDSQCDRGEVTARPRTTFDFTNRTGTIVFDLDGAQRRDTWYLDLMSNPMDLNGLVNLDVSNDNVTGPALRIKQSGQLLSMFYVDALGQETNVGQLAPGDTWWEGADWRGMPFIPNIRRHFVVHISRTHADVFVNGQEMIQATLNLPFEQATVLWNNFSYNTAKGNDVASLQHWDNFGFDGPAPTTVTHDYLDANYAGAMDAAELQAWNGTQTLTRTISIPDSVAGASSARIMLTLQSLYNNTYAWQSTDTISINGHVQAVPQNTGPSAASAADGIHCLPLVLAVDPAWLHTGDNNIVLTMGNAGFANLHLEVSFPKGSEPSYTQPVAPTSPLSFLPAHIPPGNSTQILNGVWMAPSGHTYADQAAQIFPVSGTFSLPITGDKGIEMDATGKNTGIARVQVLLDGTSIVDQNTAADVPAPSVYIPWTFDTTTIPNGKHTFIVRLYDAAGTSSIPDYFQANITTPTDWPFTLDVENAISGPTPTITSVPVTATVTLPSATPTALRFRLMPTVMPTHVAQPTNTRVATERPSATPSVVPTSTPKPTAAPIEARLTLLDSVSATKATVGSLETLTTHLASRRTQVVSFAMVVQTKHRGVWVTVGNFTEKHVLLQSARSRALTHHWRVPGTPGTYRFMASASASNHTVWGNKVGFSGSSGH